MTTTAQAKPSLGSTDCMEAAESGEATQITAAEQRGSDQADWRAIQGRCTSFPSRASGISQA